MRLLLNISLLVPLHPLLTGNVDGDVGDRDGDQGDGDGEVDDREADGDVIVKWQFLLPNQRCAE